nr:MAG TPA: hypothetical protein [Caudoviricetes sp.]
MFISVLLLFESCFSSEICNWFYMLFSLIFYSNISFWEINI